MMLGIGVLFNSCENDIDAELKEQPLDNIESSKY